jgi:cytochrome P450
MRGAGLFLVEEAEWQRHRKLLAPTFRHPASTFWRRISTPRQEHQVGRFFGAIEERLT